MARSTLRARSPFVEAAIGFILGAVGGCVLGATEDPVDKALSVLTSDDSMTPVINEVQKVGALGLGTLIGATALTTAMTSIVAGVIQAAAIASIVLATRSCSVSTRDSVTLWVSAGFAGALGTTLSGATLGVTIEWIVMKWGMLGLLWVLAVFTMTKPALHFLFKSVWRQGQACCIPAAAALDGDRGQKERDARERQQRDRVTVQIEQRILMLERGGRVNELEHRTAWEADRRERDEIEREARERKEEEMEQRTIQEWINDGLIKYVDFLAFSGVPMTMIAVVMSGFGMYGYGGHQSVFIALLASVTLIAFLLLRASDFKFWMLAACMGLLATFVIAVLTLHAGQEVVTASMKMQAAGKHVSRENLGAHMNYRSALEALNVGVFMAKLCQLGLGATVGGPLVRQGARKEKVIIGAAGMAGALLVLVEALAPVLGNGGRAGALLGVVGAAGVSVGATVAVAAGWSSWQGTLATIAGLILGALGVGKWHFVNIGVQVPTAYVFAMTQPF